MASPEMRGQCLEKVLRRVDPVHLRETGGHREGRKLGEYPNAFLSIQRGQSSELPRNGVLLGRKKQIESR